LKKLINLEYLKNRVKGAPSEGFPLRRQEGREKGREGVFCKKISSDEKNFDP
jgi:hypothetical protein